MKKSLAFGIVVAFALVICAGPALAAVEWPEKWWPSKWGAGDERGSFNTVTPKSVMKALKVPKTGKIYRLGRLYKHGMPLFGSRTYALHIPGLPAGGPLGDNQIVWNDEFIVGELGQVGTQFGLTQNGVEKLGPAIGRGVLIDMVGLLGRNMKIGEVITLAHVKKAARKAGVALPGEGDIIIFNTGWGDLWDNPAEFNKGCPGYGWEVAKWLVKRNILMTAGDTWPTDVIPGESKTGAFDVHNYMQTVHGIWNLENLNTSVLNQMARDGTYEFLGIFVPVQFWGATGSPGDFIAIK
jgi:kynurenine formamidase